MGTGHGGPKSIGDNQLEVSHRYRKLIIAPCISDDFSQTRWKPEKKAMSPATRAMLSAKLKSYWAATEGFSNCRLEVGDYFWIPAQAGIQVLSCSNQKLSGHRPSPA